jgi:hypothetical protein
LITNENESLYANNSQVKHHHCGKCGCGTYTITVEWENSQPHPTKTKVGINARLLDDFDIEKIEIVLIDGKNLW